MTPPSAVGAVSGCREAHIAPPCIRYSGVTRYYSHANPAHASNPQGIWRKICARGKSGTLAGCGGRRPGACTPAARTPVQERARRTAPSSHPIGPHPLEVVHGIADAPPGTTFSALMSCTSPSIAPFESTPMSACRARAPNDVRRGKADARRPSPHARPLATSLSNAST